MVCPMLTRLELRHSYISTDGLLRLVQSRISPPTDADVDSGATATRLQTLCLFKCMDILDFDPVLPQLRELIPEFEFDSIQRMAIRRVSPHDQDAHSGGNRGGQQ